MKKYLSCALAAFLATTFIATAAPDPAAIEAKEKAAWQAFKEKKVDDFKKVVDHDMVGVYASGVSSMTEEIADMQKWDMKSFTISDFKAHSDEKDVVVTSYKIDLQGTYDGKEASGVYYAGTVWKLENDNWLAIFHTTVKGEGPATDAQKKE